MQHLHSGATRTAVLTGLLLVLVLPLRPAIARATPAPSGLLLTVAARVCPTYDSIAANRARNDIMESLRDLGPDTTYSAGQPIDPTIEQTTQPACRPLPGWRFTLGTGYITRAVSGPWGSLSIVTNPFDTSLVTQAQTPLLDDQGNPTGQSLAGATTVALTPQQAQIATSPNSLWIQGGTPSDPILNQLYPGQYAFGALRCAIDNLNGDNVEWIGYPSGVTHVFCYAYYVQPPPTGGTIVVRKQVNAPAGTSDTFNFDGNVSFAPGGDFSLAVSDNQPAQESFIRAETGPGDEPWTVTEQPAANWQLTSLQCVSQNGKSSSAVSGATASITLSALDTVTCTYTDSFVLPPGTLTVRKVSIGGVGAFPFSIEPAAGGTATHATATTTVPGTAVDAEPGPLSLPPGSYRVTESLPSSDAGHWTVVRAVCDGQTTTGSPQATVDLPSGGAADCTFTDALIPAGAITLDKVTLHGVGTAGFVVSPVAPPAAEYHQTATTVTPGVAARAHGDPTDPLPLGRYVIDETAPATSELTDVQCDGRLVAFSGGRATVDLTPSSPRTACVFTNTLGVSPPTPTEPTAPTEPTTPGGSVPPPAVAPQADLSLTKQVSSSTAAPGQHLTYLLTIVNHGPDDATEVAVADRPPPGLSVIGATSDQGSCHTGAIIACVIGRMAPGRTVRVAVLATVDAGARGELVNAAVVGASSIDPNLANNAARARVRVSSKTAVVVPPFTG